MQKQKSYKLPKSTAPVVMPLILSIFMTCIVSGISTIRTIGFTMEALHLWPGSWLVSWIFAFPTLLIVLPLVRRIVSKVVAEA
jgi:hypothetical protein